MRWTLLLFICLLFINASSQTDTSLANKLAGRMGCGMIKKEEPVRIRIQCSAVSVSTAQPLYVIDGKLSKPEAFNSLNPNDIEGVDVLRDAAATALYGSSGANGVVLITTKRAKNCIVLLLDARDSLPVCDVAVAIKTDAGEASGISGEDGQVKLRLPSQSGTFALTAVGIGYDTVRTHICIDSGKQLQRVFLYRSTSPLDEVIIKSFPVIVCRRFMSQCGSHSYCTGHLVKQSPTENAPAQHLTSPPLQVWPNPVAKEQIINVVSSDELRGPCQIFSAAGELLQSLQTTNGQRVQVHIGNWPNGTYFLRVQSRDGKQSFTHKFIIQ